MSEQPTFTVRPLSRPARSDLKDAFRVNLSAPALLSLKLRAGDACSLSQRTKPLASAVAWQAVERIQDTVVQISKTLQDLHGLKLGDKISILRQSHQIENALVVCLQEDSQEGSGNLPGDGKISERDRAHWEWLLHDPLSRAEILSPGLKFEAVVARGQRRNFLVSSTEGIASAISRPLYRYSEATRVSIVPQDGQASSHQLESNRSTLTVTPQIGGLQRQQDQIDRILQRFEPSFRRLTNDYSYEPSPGLLIYGPKGTGKSLIIEWLAARSRAKVMRWSAASATGSKAEQELQNTFSEALTVQPCTIVIEQFDAAFSRRGNLETSTNSNLLSILRKGFEQIRKQQVLVVAEIKHPNDLPDSLRAHGRFGIEIELPVPAALSRLEILRCIRGETKQPSDDVLQELADRTHGYVGGDLFALYQRLIESAAHRTLLAQDDPNNKTTCLVEETRNLSLNPNNPQPLTLQILPTDISHALHHTRPSAMQEIILQPPNIPWTSIGGHHALKTHLQRSVSRPLRYSALMKTLNLRSNRGILLYGPPGCSKTLLVKALATESGLNFLAVKGAELVSMYVGESERAVREVFAKARAASPSIVFFDEFDAIASVRGGDSSSNGSSSGNGGGGGGLNILTTLLNELDGFEALTDVLIVAATNRPEILDPALLRPGRIDHLVYVGPPDREARREILGLWLARSRVEQSKSEGGQGGDDAVDLDILAGLTEGCSGAEVVSVCETAGGYAMDEMEEEKGPDGINMNGSKKFRMDEDVCIRMEHLLKAAGEVRKGITEEMIKAYETWGAR